MKILYDDTPVEISDDFYKDVAKLVSKEDVSDGPKVVTVSVESEGEAVYSCKLRSGTLCIQELDNTLSNSLVGALDARFLTCVDPEKNAYKFYKLEPQGGKVKASYGRMGVEKGQLFGERSCMYPESMFWVKYMEKVAKGYVDRTDIYLKDDIRYKKPEKKDEPVKTSNTASGRLFAKLSSFAKKAVRRANVRVPVTAAIIEESKRLLSLMRKSDSVDEFNRNLLDLIATLQRPVQTGYGSGVKNLMANSKSDFAKIIRREDDLIQAMEGTITKKTKVPTHDFSDFDIEVYEATEKQKKEVLSKLNDSLKPKVKKVYRVIPKEQQKRFNAYIKKHHIHQIKQLWHGSRNQNWVSIINNSLKLNPDAIITGKMFGQGIYFAPSACKSWGYTSYHGTRWAGGHSNTAYMGLYAIAYGKPLDVHNWSDYSNYSKSLIESKHCNCVHAHKGASLHEDEIILYDEDAIVMNYIVEFEG